MIITHFAGSRALRFVHVFSDVLLLDGFDSLDADYFYWSTHFDLIIIIQ